MIDNDEKEMIEVEEEISKSEKRKKRIAKIITLFMGLSMVASMLVTYNPFNKKPQQITPIPTETVEPTQPAELEQTEGEQADTEEDISAEEEQPEDIIITDDNTVIEKPNTTLEEELSDYRINFGDIVITFNALNAEILSDEVDENDMIEFQCFLEIRDTKDLATGYGFRGRYYLKDEIVDLEKDTEVEMFMRFAYHYYNMKAKEVNPQLDTSKQGTTSIPKHSSEGTQITMSSDYYKTLIFNFERNDRYEYTLEVVEE